LLAASLLAVVAVIVFVFHAGAIRPPAPVPLPVIADLGGDFELARAGGAPTRLQDYRGRIVLLFFGYTHCPDVCPTTLYALKLAMDELGKAAGQVQVIMVTVDPERDAPEQLEQYVRYFDPQFVGLSGTTEQIDQVARQYRVYRQKAQSAAGGYSVSHGAYVYLLDQKGRVRVLFGDGSKQAEIAEGVRQLLADSAVSR
jgi:protein SCO1/2